MHQHTIVRLLVAAAILLPSATHSATLTFGWLGKLQTHIAACWVFPTGVTNKTMVAARILVGLNPDGSLKNEPTIVETTNNPLSHAFAESAVAAIKRCQPYTFLPAEEYKGGWDLLDMNFSADPGAAAELKSGPRIDKGEILRKLEQIRRERREKGDSHQSAHL